MFVPLDERIRHGRLAAVDQDYHTALESCIDYWITNISNPSMEKLLEAARQVENESKTFLYLVFTACILQYSTGLLFYSLESTIHEKTLLIILHNIRLHNHVIFNIIFCNKLLTGVLISYHLIINSNTVSHQTVINISVTYIHQQIHSPVPLDKFKFTPVKQLL